MLLIGKLDKRINILEESEIKNPATGEIVNEWTVYKRLPASIATKSFGEKITGVQLINEEGIFVTIRYRNDLNTHMRAVLDGVTYSILSVMPLLSLGRNQGTIIGMIAYEPGRGE